MWEGEGSDHGAGSRGRGTLFLETGISNMTLPGFAARPGELSRLYPATATTPLPAGIAFSEPTPMSTLLRPSVPHNCSPPIHRPSANKCSWNSRPEHATADSLPLPIAGQPICVAREKNERSLGKELRARKKWEEFGERTMKTKSWGWRCVQLSDPYKRKWEEAGRPVAHPLLQCARLSVAMVVNVLSIEGWEGRRTMPEWRAWDLFYLQLSFALIAPRNCGMRGREFFVCRWSMDWWSMVSPC
jgi:hypothetical protein